VKGEELWYAFTEKSPKTLMFIPIVNMTVFFAFTIKAE